MKFELVELNVKNLDFVSVGWIRHTVIRIISFAIRVPLLLLDRVFVIVKFS